MIKTGVIGFSSDLTYQYTKNPIIVFGLLELKGLIVALLPVSYRRWAQVVLIVRSIVGRRRLIFLLRASLVTIAIVVRLWRVLHLRLGIGVAVVVVRGTAMGGHRCGGVRWINLLGLR